MNTLIFIFYLIQLTNSLNLHFSNPLQRFVYDNLTNTIILTSVNHIYSLNASDLSILSDIDISPTYKEQQQHSCLLNNKTIVSNTHYYFSTTSYLTPSINKTFNQLLLLINDSILICSTLNRGGSCQLRSLINLNLIQNSSQRIVSSSPFYPSIGFINKKNQILYISNTYDSQCDPFYEIPTISGRNLFPNNFLSVINFNSGQSALQQSTYTLRLLNIRLIKDFFLYYLYGFEYKSFSYFLTIQQSDMYHKHKFQTKILRFCQTLKQPIIQSYIEIPLTCGKNYHYLITAKYSYEKNILYGLFRNTTLANLTTTSHAICAYTIDYIQEVFFQTIKRCLVDGKGYRGLGFISPDTHCVSSKNLNEINRDYCPDENDSFFQYPIGGHRPIEQIQPIIELYEKVNFTSIEIGSNENDIIIFTGDDNGTVYTFQTSNTNEIYKQYYQSKIIIDLQLIHQKPTLKNAKLIVMTNDQIIKQNLSTCDQYTTCNECSILTHCHWCSKENRCAASFECIDEKRKMNQFDICTSIEQVIPQEIALDILHTELKIVFNVPLRNNINEYMCQFNVIDREELYYTNAILNYDTMKCLPPILKNMNYGRYNIILSIYQKNTNLTFGYYKLVFLNCSNFLSCSSCTTNSNLCLWNREIVKCISQQEQNNILSNHSHLIIHSNQCPSMYLEESLNRIAYHVDKIFHIHIEQCNQSINIHSCQLHDYRKRFSLIDSNPLLIQSFNEKNLCLLKCSFQWKNYNNSYHISFFRPLKLNLSIEFSNNQTFIMPHTHISLYRCERMALNCTSCLQLDSSFGCIWCNNKCMLKNQSLKCVNKRECLLPIIQSVEPMILPLNGGTIVTIKGEHFDLSDLSIAIADILCQVIEEESSHNQIVCRSGDAGSTFHTGLVHLKFGLYGPDIYSNQIISYIHPKINSIEPLVGIQSGGTHITIHGENFTIGNSHITVLIGNQSCQLLSISQIKIECQTRSFSHSMINENERIKIAFDRQTKLVYEEFFTIVSNPILYSFDQFFQYKSFKSGGHRIIIHGENFNRVQNIQMEFQHHIFVSPLFHNNTHIIFVTPSIHELNLNQQQTIEITIHLDHFNKTSSLIYTNDPFIFELEPLLQPYTNQLVIQGINLTTIGHTKNDIIVYIGCDLCTIIHLQNDKLICQPPFYRPEKYLKTKLCYNSEHPTITVSIDNIHTHVGFMIYPKKLILLGVISGCVITILFIVPIILVIVCLKIRYSKQKYLQRYLYTNSITPEIEKEKVYQPLNISSTSLQIRSYLNYLQLCYYSNHLISNKIQYNIKPNIINQFKFFIENNDQFLNYLFQLSIQLNNKQILNDLVLTQRYNLKKLFQFNHDLIYFNICILTTYDVFLTNPIQSLFSQLYYQLKAKIHSGPIDAIEQTMSYYSLNVNTILHDHSILFKKIQLIVHIDLNNNSNDLVLNITCLTCDTISQVKEKILYQLKLLSRTSLNECKLYLLTNHSCSSSSSSSTASSSVPLVRKSLLTQVLFNRTIKYSTTTINDPYHDSNILLLNDIDNTNENIHNSKKLNTLEHYGIVIDGYELKMILANKQTNFIHNSLDLRNSLQSSCHYCSLSTSDDKILFNYLTTSPFSDTNSFTLKEEDRTRYIHLLNHTYEEIGGELGHLLMDNNHNETYRLFETKSVIHSILINIIEILFTNLIHSDTYLSELIEQYIQFFHIFYAHFIPYVFQNFNCLFDISNDKCLNSSFNILAMIFQRACCQQNESKCSLCIELLNNKNYSINIQNSTLLFADEIQRVRLYYSNLERTLTNKNKSSEYSSTNTGIDQKFELDDSIYYNLIDYTYLHTDEIIKHLRNQSFDNDTLSLFLNLMQMYQSNERS
ncbi:unnamed protein product [Adineta steineri]|uniref:Sema domain-containing protein n=1 Tax=Adineta steineri TaxID=433720 RepID=A0A818WV14_9BILA|nr:unnamed protein product [Adineta steineri]CAF3730209.1 unnamed protein product [Adineta steineri]